MMERQTPEDMRYALYREYIGDQRRVNDRRLVAVAPTVEALQPAYDQDSRYRPMYKYRVEDWDTGRTIQYV